MFDKFTTWAGSTIATATAIFGTISHEDARLWLVAVASIGVSIWGSIRGRRKINADAEAAEARANAERYEAQRERIELCAACIRCGVKPYTCVVGIDKRPKECPMKGGYAP